MSYSNPITNETASEAAGEIICISPSDGFEYFPAGEGRVTDSGNKYILTLRAAPSSKKPKPGEPVMLGLTSLDGSGKYYEIGMTRLWDASVGCNARIISRTGRELVIYNDIRDGSACAVVYDLVEKKERKTLPYPVLDITEDGKTALSLEFACLKKLSPEKPAVLRFDTESCDKEEILSFSDITSFDAEDGFDSAIHSVSGLRISPDGKKVMLIHSASVGGRSSGRLLVFDISGKKIKRIGSKAYSAKYAVWSGNDEIMGCFCKNGGEARCFTASLSDTQPRMLWHELKDLNCCVPFSEKGLFAAEVSCEKGSELYLLTLKDKRSRLLAKRKLPSRLSQLGFFRPVTAWDDSFAVFGGMNGGKRAMYRVQIIRPNLERYDRAAEKDHSVTVMMAAYNGEKYLKEQLDSLLAQKGVRVNIFVRDDGSSDATGAILDDYRSRGLLKWYRGEHLNVNKGFLELMKNAPKADYYAFCDQDDVWDDDKLLAAVTELDNMDNTKPAMYYCGQRLVDEKLELISVHSVHTQRNPHTMFFFSNVAGCTAVMNQKLLDAINSAEPEFIHSHDNWALKVCLALGGSYVTDPVARISYRQHGGNAVGLNVGLRGRYRQVRRYMSIKLKKQCENLLICYGSRMTPEYKKIAEDICNYDISFGNRKRLLKEHDVDFKNRGFNTVIKMKVLLRKL